MSLLRRSPSRADQLAIWLDETCPLLLADLPQPHTTFLTMAYGGDPPRVMVRKAAFLGETGLSLRVATHRYSDLLDANKLRETTLANMRRALGDHTHQGPDTWTTRAVKVDGLDTDFMVSEPAPNTWVAVGRVGGGNFCVISAQQHPFGTASLVSADPAQNVPAELC